MSKETVVPARNKENQKNVYVKKSFLFLSVAWKV